MDVSRNRHSFFSRDRKTSWKRMGGVLNSILHLVWTFRRTDWAAEGWRPDCVNAADVLVIDFAITLETLAKLKLEIESIPGIWCNIIRGSMAQNKRNMTTDTIMMMIDEIVEGTYMMPPLHYTSSQIDVHEATQAARMANLRKSLIEAAFCPVSIRL